MRPGRNFFLIQIAHEWQIFPLSPTDKGGKVCPVCLQVSYGLVYSLRLLGGHCEIKEAGLDRTWVWPRWAPISSYVLIKKDGLHSRALQWNYTSGLLLWSPSDLHFLWKAPCVNIVNQSTYRMMLQAVGFILFELALKNIKPSNCQDATNLLLTWIASGTWHNIATLAVNSYLHSSLVTFGCHISFFERLSFIFSMLCRSLKCVKTLPWWTNGVLLNSTCRCLHCAYQEFATAIWQLI